MAGTIGTVAHNLWYGLNFRGKKEAKGYLKLAASRGCFTVYGALYATVALNELAIRTADCDGKIFGGALKTSSAIAATVFIEGAITAILSPIWGVIADTVSARKLLFMVAHCFWIGMVAFQIGLISDETPPESYLMLFIVTTVLMSIGLELSIILLVSYLPEVCDDDLEVAALTGRGYAYVNGMQLFLALFVTGITFVTGVDDLDNDAFVVAQIAGATTIVIWLYFTIPGLMLIDGRPKDTPAGGAFRSLVQLKSLFRDIVTRYKQVGIFLSSYMFFFAGVNNVVALATQFLLANVGLSAFNVSVVSAILLVFAVIGAVLLEPIVARFNLKRSYMLCIAFWFTISTIGPFAMNGEVVGKENNTDIVVAAGCPDDAELVDDVEPAAGAFYIVILFSMLYGIGIGTSFGLVQTIYVAMIPGGQESAYFGLKTVFSKLLVWAPALCYTAVNEALDDGYAFAFLSIAPFFFIGGVIAFFVDVEQAKEDIEDTLTKRFGYGEALDVAKVVESVFEDHEAETEKEKVDAEAEADEEADEEGTLPPKPEVAPESSASL
uniref:Major facilitator superfamily (MFS) profile domain-containing protein n=1 Tax=Aplanochytrium stocchinoi TaxID=215587 RepID=A0A6S8FWU9_9STRA|mmetsp:Transcript_17923/g.22856  ORF Transcript_17923/g.22856 Transcript_17923/m.22856 type:complete len:551 (-) Transcript_17923:1485-3137(-)|eukprot:CAMPEP_0204866586 /NCGR_PEP_ID=MMETSP1348-20121228/17902_1 /ASSEMBLY_ACC=CAM_ASM_000700 /TAXON_ID=215587 /ORGANISM="Aplanochytrium stocchinoi, Strain GSBS06" /LENGTH=550 /DNA_ID=CAMNT_0052018519 /DNA_START=82 /DNA_END=1734 /DNA_ORIENTATION=+